MLSTRVIPCLLLQGHRLVKTVKFSRPVYIGDPINAIKIFNEKEVDELVILDITATAEGKKPDVKFISDIAGECFMPLTYGGGIKSLEDIKQILNAGAEKVVINTYAVQNPGFIKAASELYGSQSIVVSIDVRKNLFNKHEVFTCGGKNGSGIGPVDHAKVMAKMGAGEIFLNSVDRDGTMTGYDIELIKMVSHAVSVPVIACGGAGRLSDFTDAVELGGVSAVAAGSFFVFHGKHRAVLISYPNKDELSAVLDSRHRADYQNA